MGWLDKLFGKEESNTKTTTSATNHSNPFAGLTGIRFGRYSDNNKTYKKTRAGI